MAILHRNQSIIHKLLQCTSPKITSSLTLFRVKSSSESIQMKQTESGTISTSITKKLKESLTPQYLEVINESYQHNVPPGSETHFKVIVVSSHFEDTPLIKRHRLVNEILGKELNGGVHALSILAKTPSQWKASDKKIESSPPCRGGFGK